MKYKVLGFASIGLIFVTLWFFIKPKEGIDPVLYDAKNIDSILIYKNNKINTLTNLSDLVKVTEQLKKCKRINIDRTNLNTGFIDLSFYARNSKRPYLIRILYNYHGIVIKNYDFYYQNDSLNTIIVDYLKKGSIVVN